MAKKLSRKQKVQQQRARIKQERKQIERERRERERERLQSKKFDTIIKDNIEKDINIKPINAATPLENINRTMNYIRNNPNLNRDNNLGFRLKNVMDLLTGDGTKRYEAGKDYGFFEINSSWDGKISSLVGNVTFKDLDNNAEAAEYLNDIAESKWGDEERHKQYLKDAAHNRWEQNTSNLDLSNIDSTSLELIEQIMNSSDMWQIIVEDKGATGMKDYKKSYESSQVEQTWENTVIDLSDVLLQGVKNKKLKRGDLDTLKRMIINHDDFKSIVKFINELLEKYKK